MAANRGKDVLYYVCVKCGGVPCQDQNKHRLQVNQPLIKKSPSPFICCWNHSAIVPISNQGQVVWKEKEEEVKVVVVIPKDIQCLT